MQLIVYCIAALTALSDKLSYMTFLSTEWHIEAVIKSVCQVLSKFASNTFQDNSGVSTFTLQ